MDFRILPILVLAAFVGIVAVFGLALSQKISGDPTHRRRSAVGGALSQVIGAAVAIAALPWQWGCIAAGTAAQIGAALLFAWLRSGDYSDGDLGLVVWIVIAVLVLAVAGLVAVATGGISLLWGPA